MRLLLNKAKPKLLAGLVMLSASSFDATAADDNTYPVDLPTVLRLAGAQNLDIQTAREQLREAEARRTSALERLFPWVAPGITYHRRDGVAQAVPSGIISDAHFQSYSPGVSLQAQVDLGDAIYASLSAKQLVLAASEALEGQRQETILGAATSYFDLAKARGLVEIAADALKTSQDYELQLAHAVEAGIVFKGDQLRVQTQTKQFQMALRQAVERQRVTSVELGRILHLEVNLELVPQQQGLDRLALVDTNLSVTVLLERALSSRPELKQSRALIASARESQDGARYGPLIPSVSAQVFGGGLGGGPDSGPSHFAAQGDYLVGLSWRIGPGGLFDPGRAHATRSRVAQTELADAKLKDDITSQVVAGLARVQSLSDQIQLAGEKLAFATETLRVTHERKQYGVGIVLEDLQAQQDLQRARADYLDAVAEFNKAQYTLFKATGGLTGASPP